MKLSVSQQMAAKNTNGTHFGKTHSARPFRTACGLVVTAGQILLLAGCAAHVPPKVTQLPELHPPFPIEKKLARALLPEKAIVPKQITLNIVYQWSEPNPIALEVWHSTAPISKPGGPTWSVLMSLTNGAPWTHPVILPATSDQEWFQVRGRDPHTGVTGAWATVQQ